MTSKIKIEPILSEEETKRLIAGDKDFAKKAITSLSPQIPVGLWIVSSSSNDSDGTNNAKPHKITQIRTVDAYCDGWQASEGVVTCKKCSHAVIVTINNNDGGYYGECRNCPEEAQGELGKPMMSNTNT